jgi:hypothetical protein
MNFNLGLVDIATDEFITESFNLHEYGGTGMSVPYYIYALNGTAYHLQ